MYTKYISDSKEICFNKQVEVFEYLYIKESTLRKNPRLSLSTFGTLKLKLSSGTLKII